MKVSLTQPRDLRQCEDGMPRKPQWSIFQSRLASTGPAEDRIETIPWRLNNLNSLKFGQVEMYTSWCEFKCVDLPFCMKKQLKRRWSGVRNEQKVSLHLHKKCCYTKWIISAVNCISKAPCAQSTVSSCKSHACTPKWFSRGVLLSYSWSDGYLLIPDHCFIRKFVEFRTFCEIPKILIYWQSPKNHMRQNRHQNLKM